MVVVVLMVACCGAEWVGMPQDTSQRLGLNATFNCSSDTDDGANVAWLKVDDVTGTTSLLFFNTDPWHVNVTRRMRADALPGGGVALTLTSLERSDDGRYQCLISNSKLSHTVRLTVLGMSPRLSLSLSLSRTFRSQVFSLPGAKVPIGELSPRGAKIPVSDKSRNLVMFFSVSLCLLILCIIALM